jgi:hypothetical protein
MHKNQTVADMADEVLARQAAARAEQTGESYGKALETVLKTEPGRQLRELRDGPHHDKRAQHWQEGLAQEPAEERAEALGWSSADEVPASPVDDQRRGYR